MAADKALNVRANNPQHLRQHFGVRRHNVARFQPSLFAVHIGNDAARFLHNQRACGNVPRF